MTSHSSSEPTLPAYLQIKNFVLEKIQSGQWRAGDLVPTELALCKQFGVSRMTVNRALRELTNDALLVRIKGSGTYVAQPKFQSTLIEIRSIAQDIRERGHQHSCQVLSMERLQASPAQARLYDIAPGATLFHSIIVHAENGLPIQYEDRLVDAHMAPDYMEQDWDQITPNEYLLRVAPLPTGFYSIEVLVPPAGIAQALHMKEQQPCLVMDRRTFSSEQFTTHARLWHPGDRYKFTGKM
ncbi:histidine utilization repressor [Alcaligenes faecalis]|uniref:histidine utilization repressor n=1 Tax=Alcaligenes faecalis TaxID=511 RepID=UPI002932879A|nr:histidine utilization repressor [Alcaligenes faecalis]MDV2117562.1 histidine utilization repressor [Alcaligenes faecalis]